MNIWNTIKELVFGPPLKKQFEELLEKQDEVVEPVEEVKEEPAEEVVPVKKKTTRTKKK